MLKSQYPVGMKEDEGAKLQVNDYTNAFTKALDKLDDKLQGSATFFSKRVFLANDLPDMSDGGGDEDLDLESMWDDNKYEEIPPIATIPTQTTYSDTSDVEFDES